MKKFLIAGSSLAAVAAAGSAGAVDVTLGGSIDMGVEYGVGKEEGANHFAIGDNYQSISISIAAAGTTDAGLKFGGSFGLSTATELVFDPYHVGAAGNTTSATSGRTANGARDANNVKYSQLLVNADASANIRGNAFNVSGGGQVLAGSIVSVKINSEWHAAEDSVSTYVGSVNALASQSAVCKVAGAIAGGGAGSVARLDADGVAVNSLSLATGVIPAGVVTSLAAGTLTAFSAGTAAGAAAAMKIVAGTKVVVDRTTAGQVTISAATVAAGPFMEVKMTSSTTKMVIGGVCVTNTFDATDTQIHMDVANRVLHVSDASIYIEGGFGRLAISQSDYGGSVSGIGDAGDEVEIGGPNASLSSVSFMGVTGHAVVDLDTINLGERPNYSFGTTVDLLGLTIAVEIEDEQGDGTTNTWIDIWDAATTYDLNGMSVAIATDDDGDWAMSLGYELLGFSMSSTIENVAPGASDKSGLNIDTSFATSLNGVAVSVGLDEDLNWTIGAEYALGNSGLAMYMNYSQEDEGGNIGATMSF
jgi:hypothetical protein